MMQENMEALPLGAFETDVVGATCRSACAHVYTVECPVWRAYGMYCDVSHPERCHFFKQKDTSSSDKPVGVEVYCTANCSDVCKKYKTQSCPTWFFMHEHGYEVVEGKVGKCVSYYLDELVDGRQQASPLKPSVNVLVIPGFTPPSKPVVVSPVTGQPKLPSTEAEWTSQDLKHQISSTIGYVKGQPLRDGTLAKPKESVSTEAKAGDTCVCPKPGCGKLGVIVRKPYHGKHKTTWFIYVRHYDPKTKRPKDHYIMKES